MEVSLRKKNLINMCWDNLFTPMKEVHIFFQDFFESLAECPKRTLVSPGTFRGLFHFIMLKVKNKSEVVQLNMCDIDPIIVKFNQSHLSLLRGIMNSHLEPEGQK